MATVAFPAGFYLTRESGFDHHPSEALDILTDGTPRSRTLTTKKFVTITCKVEHLFTAQKDVLEAFILANSANDITMTVDGIDYIGRIQGGHKATMTGVLHNISFSYYAERL